MLCAALVIPAGIPANDFPRCTAAPLPPCSLPDDMHSTHPRLSPTRSTIANPGQHRLLLLCCTIVAVALIRDGDDEPLTMPGRGRNGTMGCRRSGRQRCTPNAEAPESGSRAEHTREHRNLSRCSGVVELRWKMREMRPPRFHHCQIFLLSNTC